MDQLILPAIAPQEPKIGTQNARVLDVLREASGEWISGQHFLRTMLLSQYHARIHDLEAMGWPIQHSDFTDEFGFKSYRIELLSELLDKKGRS